MILKDSDFRVSVVGLGYVGLTLAIVMAEAGLRVAGLEKNRDILNCLVNGEAHFFEEGLQKRLALLVADSSEGKRLVFSGSINESSDVWIITVGTPLKEGAEEPNMDFFTLVARSIGKQLQRGNLIIARSTVPIGTVRNTLIPILEGTSGLKAGDDFYVVFAPERTVEGAALREIKILPQIIGGINNASVKKAKAFFESFVEETVEVESLEAAEMIKLLDNTYRDFIFAYANQMSIVSSKMGIDFNSLVKVANYHYSRNKIARPSPGVGGACLSKDPYIFHESCRKIGVSSDFVIQARKINESMPGHVVRIMKQKTSDIRLDISHASVFLMGLAFKGRPATSDLRGSVSLEYIELLKKEGVSQLLAYDEYVSKEKVESLGVEYKEIKEGIMTADLIMILNNNPSYAECPIYSFLKQREKPCVFFDGWAQFSEEAFRSLPNVYYVSV